MKKILIVDDLHPAFRIAAEEMGFEVDDRPQIKKAEVLEILKNYQGLAIRTKFRVDKEIIDVAPNLKFVARAGAGMDNIDVAYADEKNIQLMNAPEGNRDAVGEHCVGMLLSLMNNFRKADTEIRNGIWEREGNRGYELMGKTVGIIGYGNNGAAFAKKLKGFDVKVLAYDKYKTRFTDDHAKEASMEEIVKYSDVVSLHIPLTRETKQMIDDEYFRHFRRPFFFLNAARGEIVNTQSVLKAIKEGKILGAGLDVLEAEKFPLLTDAEFYKDLIANGKVLLTPHIGGWTFDSYRKISEVLADKLKNLEI
ncbi:phosphoglycerate dehydrogenase [Pedobacter psychrophilus]|uniref:Phosphoglycerate dehydrogenase n=1 Tax=Pedobacter psychrophilus TaxID=1826909 RepID=A0A179DCQ2_9SPHI|nr:NAD(P)-dependent oxidoreductase [Pedobacter psychrophilus]OAQ38826.1 phosphoglycerate dehydrogenase [Pedobacter psychrophilus]